MDKQETGPSRRHVKTYRYVHTWAAGPEQEAIVMLQGNIAAVLKTGLQVLKQSSCWNALQHAKGLQQDC